MIQKIRDLIDRHQHSGLEAKIKELAMTSKQAEKLKSCKMKEGWMKNDEWWIKNDEGLMKNDEWRMMMDEWWWMNDEGWRMMISSCWGVLRPDRQTDWRTNEMTLVNVESLLRMKTHIHTWYMIFGNLSGTVQDFKMSFEKAYWEVRVLIFN